jgi:hypothetical protein
MAGAVEWWWVEWVGEETSAYGDLGMVAGARRNRPAGGLLELCFLCFLFLEEEESVSLLVARNRMTIAIQITLFKCSNKTCSSDDFY